MIDALIGIAVLIGAVAVAYWRGQKKQKRDAQEAARKRAKEIDDAIDASASGGGDWHDRLRDHNDL